MHTSNTDSMNTAHRLTRAHPKMVAASKAKLMVKEFIKIGDFHGAAFWSSVTQRILTTVFA